MDYISTRGGIPAASFTESVTMGLARDGGLLLPAAIPDVTARLAAWRALSYRELAFEVMSLYADVPAADLRDLIGRSYASFRSEDVAPVRRVGDVYVLELFHGPTLAFKDVALQFLGKLFEYILKRESRELNILAATSGDTGSAAIWGVRGMARIRIFVMHPRGRISPNQERQMTSVLDGNVHNLAIDGTFDDCQRIMKTIFRDLPFKDRYALGTVNSINWARLLAQVVYYFHAAFRVMEQTGAARVRFAVPTGNFGDIFAGWLAARMGLPVGRLILAANENDILARFFNTGEYSLGKVMPTLSPSMDIQVASNFERYLYYRVGENAERLTRLMAAFESGGRMRLSASDGASVDPLMAAGVADTPSTLRTIRDCWERQGYLLDPHTAVGVCVGQEHRSADEPLICLATAHPAKFPDAIRQATGRDLAHHPLLDELADKPTRRELLPASVDAVRAYLQSHVGGDGKDPP